MKKLTHAERIRRALTSIDDAERMYDGARPVDPNQEGWKDGKRVGHSAPLHVVADVAGMEQLREQLRAARTELHDALAALVEFETAKPKAKARAR